jgi:hypothetical protein
VKNVRSLHGIGKLALAAVVSLGVVFLIPAVASADPGSPGLDQASSAVYPPGCKTAEKCPTADEDTNQVLGSGESGNDDSGDPGTPPSAVVSASEGSSLPFTGLSAPVLLVASLLLLGLGLAIRRFAPKCSPAGE